MIRQIWTSLIVAALVALVAVGCATGGGAESTPTDDSSQNAQSAIDRARSRAASAAERAGPFELKARVNPPDCDAPVFEIHARGRWERAWLRGSGSIEQQLDALRSPDRSIATSHGTFRVRGDYTGSRRADTGKQYPVFRVQQITDPNS